MKVQIIEHEGRPEWAVLRYEEYLGLLERLEEADDGRAFDRAKADLASGNDELIPAVVVDRLSAGESPLRVWREHRGLTQQELAEAVGRGKAYISQLETGARSGAPGTLRALAAKLDLDMEDLIPWPQE